MSKSLRPAEIRRRRHRRQKRRRRYARMPRRTLSRWQGELHAAAVNNAWMNRYQPEFVPWSGR